MASNAASFLRDVDAYLFDVFGTTVNWFTTVTRELTRRSKGAICQDQDAAQFAHEWRQGYYSHFSDLYSGGEGDLNIDVIHRKVLDEMLASPERSHLASVWDEPARRDLVQMWHDLDVYEDTIPGMVELAKSGLVIALSNGTYRLLVDLSKNKQLPWDGILAAEFFKTYKPLADAYLSASYHLGIPPERIAMVASHKWDLYAAASAGLHTIYIPRPEEDTEEDRENTKSKVEGGSVDLVVKDFKELAALAAEARKSRHPPVAVTSKL